MRVQHEIREDDRGYTFVATGRRRIFSAQARNGRIGKGTEDSRGEGLNLFYQQDGQQAVNYDLCMKPRAGARMRAVSRDGRDEDAVGACTCQVDAGTE